MQMRLSTCFDLILRLDAFTDHFKDDLDVIPLKKGNTKNKPINGRGLVLGPQKCICYLLIHLESKCFKQQYILTHVILDFVKNLEREGRPNTAGQDVIWE